MAGGCDVPAMHRLSVPPAGSRELVLFNGNTEEPPDTGPSIERLQQELAAAKGQVRIANLDLERAAEDLATLRLDKSDAERTAVEEFHLRVNMERDFLLADASQKELAAANAALRQQLEGAGEDRVRLPQLMTSLNRAIERERATSSQTAGLRDALQAATATAERLTQEREALEQRVSEFFAGSWRLGSPKRALQQILGRQEAG